MKLKYSLKKALRRFGIDVSRYPGASVDLHRMLTKYGVDMVFDIGAHRGQSAERLRSMGFEGRIVSFEPVPSLFRELSRKAQRDLMWAVENVALGAVAGEADINVSGGHSGASSLLEMTQNVTINAPDQRVVSKERVIIQTLSAMLRKHYPVGNRCFLKLDVQGYEKYVLEGGGDGLGNVVGLKVECSIVENYKGETLMSEMLSFLGELGFRVVSFENGWGNPSTGELFQVDCTLFRPTRLLEAASGDSN